MEMFQPRINLISCLQSSDFDQEHHPLLVKGVIFPELIERNQFHHSFLMTFISLLLKIAYGFSVRLGMTDLVTLFREGSRATHGF